MFNRIPFIATILALGLFRGAFVQAACPTVDGYDFYLLQEVTGAFTVYSVNTSATPASLGATCSKTPRCNAFTTSGLLQIVPMAPIFSVLDGSDPATQACDGIYVAKKTLTGLNLPDDVNVTTMRAAGTRRLLDIQATLAAAQKVAAKLLARNITRANAASNKTELIKAFKDSKTPMAQSSDTDGSYTFAGVVAALTYPVWDSRTANGTTYNYISPVKDQGSCGSCVAFAATAAAETAVAVGNATLANTNDLSEQWLFFCNGRYSPSCSTGWYGSQAADVIASFGMPYEKDYPYTASPGCTLAYSPETRPGGNFTRTTYTDINLAKQHIRDYGSVMTFFAVYNDFFSWSATSPPYRWDGVSSLAGYHQVLTVGYNDTGAFWIVKNSWGTGWGDKGFFRIAYTANVGFMSGSGDNIIGLTWKPTYSPPPSPPPPAAVCGDGTCDASETCSSCPDDCGACAVCGDGMCSGGETCSTCPADCGIPLANGTLTCCGDGVCNAAAGESCSSCAADCGTCPTCNKNGICEPALGEKCVSGSTGCSDCGTCSGSYCGDGKCISARKGYSESCGTCPTDCGTCGDTRGYCGDGVCTAALNETTSTCSRDCKSTKFAKVPPGLAQTAAVNKKKRALRAVLV